MEQKDCTGFCTCYRGQALQQKLLKLVGEFQEYEDSAAEQYDNPVSGAYSNAVYQLKKALGLPVEEDE